MPTRAILTTVRPPGSNPDGVVQAILDLRHRALRDFNAPLGSLQLQLSPWEEMNLLNSHFGMGVAMSTRGSVGMTVFGIPVRVDEAVQGIALILSEDERPVRAPEFPRYVVNEPAPTGRAIIVRR